MSSRALPVNASINFVSRHYADRFEDAACRGIDPEDIDRIFFPSSKTTGPHPAALENEGRAFCRRCPSHTRLACLDTALELGGKAIGIWADTNEAQRKKILNRRKGIA